MGFEPTTFFMASRSPLVPDFIRCVQDGNRLASVGLSQLGKRLLGTRIEDEVGATPLRSCQCPPTHEPAGSPESAWDSRTVIADA